MNNVTGLITNLWQNDPVLVIALGVILILLVYLEIMHLRVQLLANALGAVGDVISSSGSGDSGSGCVTTLLTLILMIGLLFGIFIVLFV